MINWDQETVDRIKVEFKNYFLNERRLLVSVWSTSHAKYTIYISLACYPIFPAIHLEPTYKPEDVWNNIDKSRYNKLTTAGLDEFNYQFYTRNRNNELDEQFPNFKKRLEDYQYSSNEDRIRPYLLSLAFDEPFDEIVRRLKPDNSHFFKD